MSGSLKPYFYVVYSAVTGTDSLIQSLEALPIVGDGEHIGQDFTFRTEDEAVMFILGVFHISP